MFSDAALGLRPIEPDDMSYKEYLDRPYGPAASAGLITILNLFREVKYLPSNKLLTLIIAVEKRRLK